MPKKIENIKRDEISDNDIVAAENFAALVLDGNSGGHDILHVKRVENNARLIMAGEKTLNADRRMTLLCCALHDVDDRKIKCAAECDFSNLHKFFETVGLSERAYERARRIISCVSFTDNKIKDANIDNEAKIVQDADRLDALGAIGIARAFAYGGNAGRKMYGESGGTTLAHFYDKLLLLSELMNTPTAKIIAERRTQYMKKFLIEFDNEINGAD